MFLESAYSYVCLVVTLEHNEVVGLLSILIFNLGYEYSDLHANMLKSLEKRKKEALVAALLRNKARVLLHGTCGNCILTCFFSINYLC